MTYAVTGIYQCVRGPRASWAGRVCACDINRCAAATIFSLPFGMIPGRSLAAAWLGARLPCRPVGGVEGAVVSSRRLKIKQIVPKTGSEREKNRKTTKKKVIKKKCIYTKPSREIKSRFGHPSTTTHQ